MSALVLTKEQVPPATLWSRLIESFQMAQLVCHVFYLGALPALKQQISAASLPKVLNPWAWRDLIWANAMPSLLRMHDANTYDAKKSLVGQAYGRVLEVGAGSGETVKYYDESKIAELFALEPFAPAVPHLAKTIAARGKKFESRSRIIVAGIQDDAALSQYGVTANSLDSLILVRCLCSIPGGPEAHLGRCLDLLKPGGVLIMIEHGLQLEDRFTRLLQGALNPFWSFLANGCQLTRNSLGTLQALSSCESVEVQRPKGQTAAAIIPYVFVKATKKG